MSEEIIKASGYFGGYSANNNYDVQLKVKFPSEQLASALQFVAGLQKQVNLKAKIGDDIIPLAFFNVYSIRIDKDSGCTITFKSNKNACKFENLAKLTVDEAFIDFAAKVIDN